MSVERGTVTKVEGSKMEVKLSSGQRVEVQSTGVHERGESVTLRDGKPLSRMNS